jgi:hypothetical protein
MACLDQHGRPWSATEEAMLRNLIAAGASKGDIAARLGRTRNGIANKMADLARRSKGLVSPYAIRRDNAG